MKRSIQYILSGLLLLTLSQSGFAGEAASELEVKLYPNPSNGEFTIEFERRADAELSARIYDMTGKLVKDFKEELKQEDLKVRLEVRLENPTEGIYFLKIESGKERITRKIVVR